MPGIDAARAARTKASLDPNRPWVVLFEHEYEPGAFCRFELAFPLDHEHDAKRVVDAFAEGDADVPVT